MGGTAQNLASPRDFTYCVSIRLLIQTAVAAFDPIFEDNKLDGRAVTVFVALFNVATQARKEDVHNFCLLVHVNGVVHKIDNSMRNFSYFHIMFVITNKYKNISDALACWFII